jgi:hypothetical protein
MFNVRPNNSTPGFRVGFDDDEVGFNVAEPYSFHEVAPSPFAKFDLAANPYWRVASDRLSGLGWEGTDLAPAMRFAAAGLQTPSAVDTTEELCREVGRSGPLCLYRCADGKMIYTPNYPSGPCPPFQARGIGTFPWGQ